MEARQRDPVLRDAYIRRIANYRADQLVFLDESGLNTNMGERRYGRGPKGKKIVHKVTPGRSPNISLLPAMTVNGYLACTTFQGSVERRAFLDFLKTDLFPRCGRFPGPKSVLILDNASIHHGDVCMPCFYTHCPGNWKTL